MWEEKEANSRLLDTVSEEEEIEAALEWDRAQQESGTGSYSLQPLHDQPGPSNAPRVIAAAPARIAQRPQATAAAPTTAVHSDLGVRITAPPRTESSIPVPMATNPVTRQLAFNTVTPEPVGARRPPLDPDGH
eukprot:5675129-Pleurochrysis_carterae.AAC.1